MQETFDALDKAVPFDGRETAVFWIYGIFLAMDIICNLTLLAMPESQINYKEKFWFTKFYWTAAVLALGIIFCVFAWGSDIKFQEQVDRIELIQQRLNGSCTDEYTTLEPAYDIAAMTEEREAYSRAFYVGYVGVGIFFIQMLWYFYHFIVYLALINYSNAFEMIGMTRKSMIETD